MNYTKQHPMAGHFTKAVKNGRYVENEKSLTVRIVGRRRDQLTQRDVNYICSFYHLPWTENWLIEGNDYDFRIIITKTNGGKNNGCN